MPDELTKALLLEEAASEAAVAEALFASVTTGVPLLRALTEARAVTPEVLERYLARPDAPFLRQVVPVVDLVERLPPGLCARLLAIPVRRDAITGTVDVVVADAGDTHAANEIAFHLGAPVRVVRASTIAVEGALRKLSRALAPLPDDERMYDSRPRAAMPPPSFKGGTLPPPAPSMKHDVGADGMLDAMNADALRPNRLPRSERQGLSVPAARPGPRSGAPPQGRRDTPPWGTPVHDATSTEGSEHPRSGPGSEIPILLTRRTFAAGRGGSARPPSRGGLADSARSEGNAVDTAHVRAIVEANEHIRASDSDPDPAMIPLARPMSMPSFIPGPPPLSAMSATFVSVTRSVQIPFADIGAILEAFRGAESRDQVLELLLTGARMVAIKIALFVVKRSGYLGWTCTPEFGERSALQAVLISLESPSVFDEAVREGLYLGPIRRDEVHAALLHAMRGASRDVAVVPVRVTGKTALVLVADQLGDAMLATRRIEQLSRAAGEAFARIVRVRR